MFLRVVRTFEYRFTLGVRRRVPAKCPLWGESLHNALRMLL